MKVRDVIEDNTSSMFYPDWQSSNRLLLYKSCKLEIFYKQNFISCDEIILMGKAKPLISKSYSISKPLDTIALCDNVVNIMFKNDRASLMLHVDEEITFNVYHIDDCTSVEN
jgi:hypothetical protein